ncbi:hypothetical protein KAU08_02860 [bacterium]|nr:hypothetical protein [bacterium]
MLQESVTTMVVTGDSINEDLRPHIFNEATIRAGIKASFVEYSGPGGTDRLVRPILLYNTAMSGHTIKMIESRFRRDCIRYNPKIAVVNGGTNDLYGSGTTETEFLSSWKSILDQCMDNGIIAAALGIVPASMFPDDIMKKRDHWNSGLKAMVKNYDGFIYINADPYVGTHRTTGPQDNIWDIRKECDLDGVHYSNEGSVKIAYAILDAIGGLL